MKCHNCGTVAQKDDKFCLHCGSPLVKNTTAASGSETMPLKEVLPADQAEKILKEAKRIVKHLSKEEQIIGGAAITGFISFFLPWFENFSKSQNGFIIASINNRTYLVIIAIFASLALLYFGQGAKKPVKIFYTSIHAVIGTFILASEFITHGFNTYPGILLLTVGGGTMAVASLFYQRKLLAMKD